MTGSKLGRLNLAARAAALYTAATPPQRRRRRRRRCRNEQGRRGLCSHRGVRSPDTTPYKRSFFAFIQSQPQAFLRILFITEILKNENMAFN